MPLNPFEAVLLRGQGEPRITPEIPPGAEQQEVEKEWEEATAAQLSLQKAAPSHLETEWFVFFIREIRAGKSVPEACFAAECEWDL